MARLRELGVRHIRDAMPSPIEPLGAGLRAARAAGIRATLATGDVKRDPGIAVADSLQVMGDDVDAFEGPNELDNGGDPNWPATLRAYMPALASAVREQAPGVPVIGPSFVDPRVAGGYPSNLPGLFNAHPYPGGGPPETVLGDAAREHAGEPRKTGMVFTETGYHNALRDTATSRLPPRRPPRYTFRGCWSPPSGWGRVERSSTSCSTRSPTRAWATCSSTSACCVTTSPPNRRYRDQDADRGRERFAGRRRTRAPALAPQGRRRRPGGALDPAPPRRLPCDRPVAAGLGLGPSEAGGDQAQAAAGGGGLRPACCAT